MSVTSLLLGLDVSPKRLGWGLVDLVTGAPVACGMEPIDLPSAGWHHQQVARALEGVDVTYASMGGEFEAVYIEDTAKAGKYRQHDAGRAQGIAQCEVERRWPWAPIEFLAPAEWRKLAGLPGNATKLKVFEHALAIGGPLIAANGVCQTQDAADALLVAVAGWHRNEDVIERAAAIAARDEESA